MNNPSESSTIPVADPVFRRCLHRLCRFWWLPLITSVVGLGIAAVVIGVTPATFYSRSRMWEPVQLRLTEGSQFTEDRQSFFSTQCELLQSDFLRRLAFERLKTASNGIPVPRGDDGEPLPLDLRVIGSAKSTVYTLEARSSHPAYAQAYLDALTAVFLEYKREAAKLVAGESLNLIAEMANRGELELRNEQDRLLEFERTNHLVAWQHEIDGAGDYASHIRKRLLDLRLEQFGTNTGMKIDALEAALRGWEVQVEDRAPRLAELEHLKRNVQHAQQQQERVRALLDSIEISRKTALQSFSILEPASPPTRSYTRETRLVKAGGIGGMGFGLGMIVLLGLKGESARHARLTARAQTLPIGSTDK
jgi:uncharacterized protein involved in exopolysaccharide biosynthesis